MIESVQSACVARSNSLRVFDKVDDFLCDNLPKGPWCLILDTVLPEMSGFDLLDIVTTRGITTSPIIVTAHGSVAVCARAFKRGVVDFIEVPFVLQSLVDAMDAALNLDAVARTAETRKEIALACVNSLTDRQREVFSLIIAGHSIKAVAHKLGVSHQTIARHRNVILRTFSVTSDAGVMRKLSEAGCLADS